MTETLDEAELREASTATVTQPKLHAQALQPAATTAARRLEKSDVLTLDVGGTIFRTRVGTLTARSKFFKQLLLSEGAIEVNLNQPLFLDLDPEAFNLILQFFRSKSPDALLGCLARYYRTKFHRRCRDCRRYSSCSPSHNVQLEPSAIDFGFCGSCWIPLGLSRDTDCDRFKHRGRGTFLNMRKIDFAGARGREACYVCVKCGTRWHTDKVITSSHKPAAADMHNVVYQLRYLQIVPFADFLEWPGWSMPATANTSSKSAVTISIGSKMLREALFRPPLKFGVLSWLNNASVSSTAAFVTKKILSRPGMSGRGLASRRATPLSLAIVSLGSSAETAAARPGHRRDPDKLLTEPPAKT
eukprot:g18062.t1